MEENTSFVYRTSCGAAPGIPSLLPLVSLPPSRPPPSRLAFWRHAFNFYRPPPPRPPATATLLVHGRPQAGWVRAGHMQYYLVRPESDTARLTVSLTTSLGQADLYMARRNESMEIDPLDDSTYRFGFGFAYFFGWESGGGGGEGGMVLLVLFTSCPGEGGEDLHVKV